MNRQPWRFSVVTDFDLRSRIADLMRVRALEMGASGDGCREGEAAFPPAVEGGADASSGEGETGISSIKANSLIESARCVCEAPCIVFVRYAADKSWFDSNEEGWDLDIRGVKSVDLLGIGACIENMSPAAGGPRRGSPAAGGPRRGAPAAGIPRRGSPAVARPSTRVAPRSPR